MNGGAFMIGKHYVSIKGQRLNNYHYSSGGGMTGGHYSENIKRYDDTKALISIESADWHSQDAEVKEYFADISIMDELEEVIRDGRMNFWNRRKFTDIFVCDGESRGYTFRFDKGYISFSSQIYPPKYSERLKKLSDVIKRHISSAELLPALVNENKNVADRQKQAEGRLYFYVCSYSADRLGIRVFNSTDEIIKLSLSYKLINADNGDTIAEEDDKYPRTMYPNSRDEIGLSISQRLGVGSYKLIINDTEIPFEIR